MLTLWPVPRLAHSLRVRRLAQLLMLFAAGAVVVHGLAGPSIAPRNLATVLTSIHWRGLLVVALLAAGNLFCAVCPMMLVRDGGRRIVTPRRRLPGWIRGKWIGLALLFAAFYAYEVFGLWERPAATAWVVIGYFALALVVDLIFEGASFCKHVCPVGQFNFVASTISPAEVRARDTTTCQTCRTADCINGRRDSPGSRPLRGCELGLFMPAKIGNLDCTWCLDCVRACPHDNIAIDTRVPGIEWLASGHRSGLGRARERLDLAVLAAFFTCAALLSAFVMTAPGHELRTWMARTLGIDRPAAIVFVMFASGTVVAPAVLIAVTAAATRRFGLTRRPFRAVAMDLAFALVPLGFGIWVAHYGFHLLTGALTIVPVAQSAVGDLLGRAWLGAPDWRWSGLRPGAVFPIQLGFVVLGACGAIGLLRGLVAGDRSTPLEVVLPGAVLVVSLTMLALWILAQPMDMRGLGGNG